VRAVQQRGRELLKQLTALLDGAQQAVCEAFAPRE
jgi:exonuclease VII small subunit